MWGAHALGRTEGTWWWLACLAAVALLSGFNNGYALRVGGFVWISLQHATREADGWDQSDAAARFYAACMLIGMIISAGLSGLFIVRLGSRNTSMLGEVFGVAGTVLGVAARGTGMIYAWRIIQGLGVGLCLTGKSLYLAESTAVSHRGGVIALLSVALSLSAVVAGLIDWEGADWRWEVLGGGVAPVLLLTLLYFMPHSPVDLRDRRCGASDAGGSAGALGRPRVQLKGTEPGESNEAVESTPLRRGACAAPPSRGLAIGCCVLVAVAKEGAGSSVLVQQTYQILYDYYRAGGSMTDAAADSQAHWMDTIGLLVQLCSGCVCVALIDRPSVGRRPLLLAGCVGQSLGVLLLALSSSASMRGLTPASLLLYAAFAPLVQGTFYPIATELVPLEARAAWLGPYYAFCQLVAFALNLAYPPAPLDPGPFFVFCFFFSAAAAGALWWLLPETGSAASLGPRSHPVSDPTPIGEVET